MGLLVEGQDNFLVLFGGLWVVMLFPMCAVEDAGRSPDRLGLARAASDSRRLAWALSNAHIAHAAHCRRCSVMPDRRHPAIAG